MKVLVTGANGLLGHHVVLELLKRQYEVRIIIRSKRNIYFDLATVEVVEGNFVDYQTFKIAAKGCQAILHIAAVTNTDLLHYEDYRRINVDAVSQIIELADELEISTIIFISTANTIGFGNEQEPSDERSMIKFPFSRSFYAQSKVEAEKLFLKASEKANHHFVIINPTFIIGAYDPKPSSGKLVLMGYNKRLMFVPKGGKNFVSASDVAMATCNALQQGKNGERYLTSGVNLTFREYYSLQKVVGSYKQYIVELPNFLVSFIGKAGDLIRRFGFRTEICSMNLNQLMIREFYRSEKSKNDLKLPETDLKIAVKDTIDWFKEKKLIN